MRLITILVMVLGSPALWGQDLRQRLELMKEQYKDLDRAHIIMEVKVYTERKSTDIIFETTATVKRLNDSYYYSLADLEMLMNEKYLLMVDRSARQIICSNRSIEEEKKFVDPVTSYLDSIPNTSDAVTFVGKEGSVEHYQLKQKKGPIALIDLFIEADRNVVSRLEYTYAEGQFAVVNFKLFDTNPTFTPEDFRETKYLQVVKGRMTTTEVYSRFNLSIN